MIFTFTFSFIQVNLAESNSDNMLKIHSKTELPSFTL